MAARLVVFLFALLAALGFFASPAQADSPQVVCLHTEWLPWPWEEECLPYRLLREIPRQALLIAARHELGLPTRDETLGERFAEEALQEVPAIHLRVRPYLGNTWKLRLHRDQSEKQEETIWQQEGTFEAWGWKTGISLLHKMDDASRKEFIEALKLAGYDGEPIPSNEDAKVPEEVEQLLGEMNFVSQFAAVRLVHQAIADGGESSALLGSLVRGYAHLAMLTHHHWNSATEAFAARSLLYAERLAERDGLDANSRWHRVYAYLLCGFHKAADNNLKGIRNQFKEEALLAENRPEWTLVVEPYFRFQREELLELAESHPSIRQLVLRLHFEQLRGIRHERWIYEYGKQMLEQCPECYGVGVEMVLTNLLGVSRPGIYYTTRSYQEHLSQRLYQMPGSPDGLRALVPDDAGTSATWASLFGDPEPRDTFSMVAEVAAKQLLEADDAEGSKSEPSWGILASLIREEQFVQVAHQFKVSMNATESSKGEAVDSVLPTIASHRYVPYIRSYAYDSRREKAAFDESLKGLRIVDPRGNMGAMFNRMYYYEFEGDKHYGWTIAKRAYWCRNFTFPSMVENMYCSRNSVWSRLRSADREMLAREMAQAAPHSPLGKRAQMSLKSKPSSRELKQWEDKAIDDPVTFLDLGNAYSKRKEYEQAIRCLEKSLKISPSYTATTALATAYREHGQEDKWLSTLESFLEVEDLGIRHASIHQMIAKDYAGRSEWELAEPHARAAAETWSAWGMHLAADVYEALNRWEDSEAWIARLTQSYPTRHGHYWYLWCRRTGQGHLYEAEDEFSKFLQLEWVQSGEGLSYRMFFHMLEGDLGQAKADHQEYLKSGLKNEWDKTATRLMLAILAKKTEDDALAEKMLSVASVELEEKLVHQAADYAKSLIIVCNGLRDGKISEEALAEYERVLPVLNEVDASRYTYLLGAALEMAGQQNQARTYWEKSAEPGGYHDIYYTTLAGVMLRDMQ